MNFRQYLKQWLRVNERSVSWLARKCDVSPAAAKYWLDGKHKPSVRHREIIEEVIGL